MQPARSTHRYALQGHELRRAVGGDRAVVDEIHPERSGGATGRGILGDTESRSEHAAVDLSIVVSWLQGEHQHRHIAVHRVTRERPRQCGEVELCVVHGGSGRQWHQQERDSGRGHLYR